MNGLFKWGIKLFDFISEIYGNKGWVVNCIILENNWFYKGIKGDCQIMLLFDFIVLGVLEVVVLCFERGKKTLEK